MAFVDYIPQYNFQSNTYLIGEGKVVEGTVQIRVPVLSPEYINCAVADSLTLPPINIDNLHTRCNDPIYVHGWEKYFNDILKLLSDRGYPNDVNSVFEHEGRRYSLDYYMIIVGTANRDFQLLTVGETLLHLRRQYACLCENDFSFSHHLANLVSSFRENLIALVEERAKLVGRHQIFAGIKGNERRTSFANKWKAKAQELADIEFKKNHRLTLMRCAE
ncbi:hypothetical protein AB4343_14910 [Vibrio breoganii]|uniref:Uncharacterized protein n=1 Tax=Vibrio breoganii TaxID=553239 RepID=A0AAP8MSZ5_9VIBR|nr:hypothetical protein [Vibrio breoganii]PMP05814.1 hypothetical protein BCS93_18220 [Vibrio breoganii]